MTGPERAPLPEDWFRRSLRALGGLVVAAVLAGIVEALYLADVLGNNGMETLQIAVFWFAACCVLASLVCVAFWFYRMWHWLPPEDRRSSLWGTPITPGMAFWMCWIPFFGFFWVFVTSIGLAEGIDRHAGTNTRPIAIAVGVLSVLGGLAWPLLPLAIAGGYLQMVVFHLRARRASPASVSAL